MAGADWPGAESQIIRVLSSCGPLRPGQVEAFWTRLPSTGIKQDFVWP